MSNYSSISLDNEVPIIDHEQDSNRRRKVKYVSWTLVGLLVVAVVVAAASKSSRVKLTPEPSLVPAKGLEPAKADLGKTECDDPDFYYKTLKTAHEMSVIALFGKPPPGPAFEASCIAKVDDYFYVVTDDAPYIAKLKNRLQFNDPQNVLINPSKPFVIQSAIMAAAAKKKEEKNKKEKKPAPPAELPEEHGFEALVYDKEKDVFSAVIEAVSLEGTDEKFHAVIFDLKVDHNANTYDIIAECPSDYEFTSANKGFEGAALINKGGSQYLLGLCEGNFCEGGARGRTPGNGRVVLLKRGSNVELHGKKYECVWQVQRVINLPKSLQFRDYSAITIRGDRVAIASQENSAVWIGHIDFETLEFKTEGERIFSAPRNAACEIQYCNVEGLEFISDSLLVAASDQMKDEGRQAFRCLEKDQSVHVFVIPAEPEAEADA